MCNRRETLITQNALVYANITNEWTIGWLAGGQNLIRMKANW